MPQDKAVLREMQVGLILVPMSCLRDRMASARLMPTISESNRGPKLQATLILQGK